MVDGYKQDMDKINTFTTMYLSKSSTKQIKP